MQVMDKSFLKKAAVLIILFVILLVVAILIQGYLKTPREEAAKSQRLIDQFFTSGGMIVWLVQLPLSLLTVYLVAQFFLTIRRKNLLPESATDDIIETITACPPKELEQFLSERTDIVSCAVAKAISQSKNDLIRFRSLLAESLQDQTAGLLRKIEWLNLIGSVSPMIGLFGTVVGMIQLFNAIVHAGGQPQPVQLAHGISVALVTTFWGLLTAIPALSIHSFLRNRIESIANEAVGQIEKIMPYIIENFKKQLQTTTPEKKQSIQPVVKTAKTVIGQPLFIDREKTDVH